MQLRHVGSWIVALALAGCTGLSVGPAESSDEPTHVEPLTPADAEPIPAQSPTTAIRRYRVADLPPDHGYTPGRWIGLYARAGGRAVGVAEVVRADDDEAELAALWVDLDAQLQPLSTGEPAPRRFGAELGHLLRRTGDSAPVHLDIGKSHGARVGDLYAALSDDPIPRELGLLKVVVLDDDARVVWVRGEAPVGARVRRVGHEAPTIAALRLLVPRLAGDRGADVAAALRGALTRVAVSAELRVEAVDVEVADAAAARALARERKADAVLWGSAKGEGVAVALQLGLEFADPRRVAEQAGFGAPRATRTLTVPPEGLGVPAQQLAPLVAGWAVHSELEARGGGSSVRAAYYFAAALASTDPQTVADARVRLLHCRLAARDWAGASRLADAVERDGEDRAQLGRRARARLAAIAGALDPAEALARAAATGASESSDRRGAADANAVLADVLRQRRDFAAAKTLLEQSVVPVYASLGARRAQAAALVLLAEVQRERGATHEALALLRDGAAPLLEQLGETSAHAAVHGSIGALLFRLGETDAALKIWEAAAATLRRTGDTAAHATVLEQLGELQEERGDLDAALQAYEKVIIPTRARLGDLRGVARARDRVGQILAQQGDLDAADPHFDAALAVFRRLGDGRAVASTRLWQAFVLSARGDAEGARRIRKEEVLPIYSHEDDRVLRALTLKELALNEHALGDIQTGMDLLQSQVIPVLARPDELREHAIAKAYLADMLVEKGRFDEAKNLLQEALTVFAELPFPSALAWTKYKLGALHHERGELDLALRLYREIALSFARLGQKSMYALVMSRIAEILVVRGDTGEALRIREEIELVECERTQDDRCKGQALVAIAEILIEQGQPDRALRRIEGELVPLVDRLDDTSLQAQARTWQADALHRLGRTQRAVRLVRDEIVPRYRDLGDEQGEAIAVSLLADIDADAGRVDAAIKTMREKVLPAFRRGTHKLNIVRGQFQLADMLLLRGHAGDRKEATALLREARGAARALGAIDLAQIEALARHHGLDLGSP